MEGVVRYVKNLCRMAVIRQLWLAPLLLTVLCIKVWVGYRDSVHSLVLRPSPRHTHTYECREMEHRGVRYPLCTYDPATDILSNNVRAFERSQVEQILHHMEGTALGFIDIGANIGVYTVPIANFGHQVVAVEPNAESAHRLMASVALGRVSHRVTVVSAGISDTRGTMYMKVDKHDKVRDSCFIVTLIDYR